MAKHIWQWDKMSANPMRVVCVKCGQRELLSKVLDEIGCEGCPIEGVQEALFDETNKAVLVQDKWMFH